MPVNPVKIVSDAMFPKCRTDLCVWDVKGDFLINASAVYCPSFRGAVPDHFPGKTRNEFA